MEYLLTAEEMKSCDGTVIRHYQVPSLVLMERAALALTELLVQEQFDLSKTLVVCGSGNNGGDGFCRRQDPEASEDRRCRLVCGQ